MITPTDVCLPALRADIDITVDPSSIGQRGYLLRVAGARRVWRISERERVTLRVLDGTLSLEGVRDAIQLEKIFANDAPPTLDELSDFVKQLGREGLLDSQEARGDRRSSVKRSIGRVLAYPIRWLLRWLIVTPWDLLSLGSLAKSLKLKQVRVGSPDRLLGFLMRLVRPLLGRVALTVSVAYSILGVGLWIGHFSAWWQSVQLLWQPWGLLLIALTGILAVHIPHQIAHGVAVVHYGARVPTWGWRFVYNLFPTFWLDLRDAAWLPEKNRRMAAAAVGILWQSMAFTTGVIGWLVEAQGTGASLLFLSLSSTALFGFILNANPLVRRDGYLVLSTWLDMPDLWERSTAYLRGWVLWEPNLEPVTQRERRWFWIYSLGVNVFGIVSTILSILFAIHLTEAYDERGATTVLFASGFIFQDHMRSIFDWVGLSRVRRSISRGVMWMLRLGFAGAVFWAMFLTYPYHAGGDTTLMSIEIAEVRTELEGLVGEVHVHEGQWVEKGATLATLLTHVQLRNLMAAEAQLAEAKARESALVAGATPEEIERARAAVMTAEAQLDWSSMRADRLKPLFERKVIGATEYENALQLQTVDERRLEEAKAALGIVTSGVRPEILQAAKAGIRSQEAIVDNFRGNVKRTALVSPISGYITTPGIDRLYGRYLQPGQRDLVATIENTKNLIAEIDVPEEDIEGISVGSKVTLYTWSYPKREFEGAVTQIAPTAAAEEVTLLKMVRVQTKIPNPDGVLKPEMTGYAKIEVGERPVWDILFRPFLRWLRLEVWSWLP